MDYTPAHLKQLANLFRLVRLRADGVVGILGLKVDGPGDLKEILAVYTSTV